MEGEKLRGERETERERERERGRGMMTRSLGSIGESKIER